MRIVLFHSEIESFNYFTDQLAGELIKRGHEPFVFDQAGLDPKRPESYAAFLDFISRKVDAVICFDGLGIREDMYIEAWDGHDAVAVDILMDPPLRFHPTLERHPRNYQLFCCDRDHVAYVKKYFGDTIARVDFMPHAGVLPGDGAPVIPWEKRTYDVLFCGTYYRPESRLARLGQIFPEGSDMMHICRLVYQTLTADSRLSVDQAVELTVKKAGLSLSREGMKTLMRCSEEVDWAIRMYRRGQVVQTLAAGGVELYLLGRGWEDHPAAGLPHVHRIDDRVPYGETLAHIANARINLNVMPGFKAGTHDRIFNTFLQHSLPLTDSSAWIDEHFTDGVDIALYGLDDLERLPSMVEGLLADAPRAEAMIQKGYEKTAGNYTWSNCADRILEAVKRHRTGG